MSALPPKADMVQRDPGVRFVPCVDGSELASKPPRSNDLAMARDMRTSARDNFMRPVHS
jgi:hypothetical protein